MASIRKENNGGQRIQFTGADGKRHTIRLGKVPRGTQVAADLTLAPIYDYADHIGLMLIAAAAGDANFAGLVDVADLGILGANWTASQTTGNAPALVPEPTTRSLLAMSVLMVGRRRR